MLNVYKYFDDAKSLPLYKEIGTKAHLLNFRAWRYEKHTKEDFEPIIHIIARVPELSYHYAAEVSHSRFPEAEPVIMKSTSACHYAMYIIKGRWKEAEPYIMKFPEYAFLYAREILATDQQWTSQPGHENGRWPEAEPYIMKDPFNTYWYSIEIIRGRWPEAEPYIMKDPEYGQKYRNRYGF